MTVYVLTSNDGGPGCQVHSVHANIASAQRAAQEYRDACSFSGEVLDWSANGLHSTGRGEFEIEPHEVEE